MPDEQTTATSTKDSTITLMALLIDTAIDEIEAGEPDKALAILRDALDAARPAPSERYPDLRKGPADAR